MGRGELLQHIRQARPRKLVDLVADADARLVHADDACFFLLIGVQ